MTSTVRNARVRNRSTVVGSSAHDSQMVIVASLTLMATLVSVWDFILLALALT